MLGNGGSRFALLEDTLFKIGDTTDSEYIGTVFSGDGMFVWHIYEDEEWEHKL